MFLGHLAVTSASFSCFFVVLWFLSIVQVPSMSTNHHWTSEEDIEEDLNLISDFYDSSSLVNEATSYKHASAQRAPSEHVRKARSKTSIYDDPFDLESETMPSCRPGRGYPLLPNNSCTKPGARSFLRQQNQTAQDIREVCAYGFSNDLIENSLGTKRVESKVSPTPPFGLTYTKPPFEGSSTCEQSSSNMTSLPLHWHSSNGVVPPPIYDIIKSGKSQRKENLKPSIDQPVITFTPIEAAPDMNSLIDFPELSK